MPICGCFHKHTLETTAPGEYRFSASVEGQPDLKGVLESTNLASSVLAGRSVFQTTIHLSGVTDGATLAKFCDQLNSTILVDLSPSLDFCHALGPYTIFDDGNHQHTDIGELVYQGKYWKNLDAVRELAIRLFGFISDHPGLRNVTAITTPPSSISNRPDLAKLWAQRFAAMKNWELLESTKIRQTQPQKQISSEDTEGDAVNRIASSMQISNVQPGAEVLILDDTIRSGGTFIELGRVLRLAGAAKIYGLAAAKDAKFTNGGIDLGKDSWL